MPKPRKTLKGKMHKLIDDCVHPHFKNHPSLILVDGLLHAIVEQNPRESVRKFTKYSLPELLKYLAR